MKGVSEFQAIFVFSLQLYTLQTKLSPPWPLQSQSPGQPCNWFSELNDYLTPAQNASDNWSFWGAVKEVWDIGKSLLCIFHSPPWEWRPLLLLLLWLHGSKTNTARSVERAHPILPCSLDAVSCWLQPLHALMKFHVRGRFHLNSFSISPTQNTGELGKDMHCLYTTKPHSRPSLLYLNWEFSVAAPSPRIFPH